MPRGVGAYQAAVYQRHLWTDGLLPAAPSFVGDDPSASPWVSQNITWTGSSAVRDPLGGYQALKSNETTATGGHGIYDLRTRATGVTHSMIVLLKAAERTYASTYHDTGSFHDYVIDLATGFSSVALGTADVSMDAVSVGNGWYLCVQQFVGGGGSEYCGWYATTDVFAALSYAGTAGSGIWYFRPRVYTRPFSAYEIEKLAAMYCWAGTGSGQSLPATNRFRNRPPLSGD